MREKLRIVFWVVVVKIAFTKARRNSGCVKESGTAIGAPAIAYRRAPPGFDACAGTIAELADDAIWRCLTRALPRFWDFVKRVDHQDTFVTLRCQGISRIKVPLANREGGL